MKQIEIESRLKKILIERFNLDESSFQNNKTFEGDLGMDSLDMVNLLLEIEAEFDVSIATAQAIYLKTIGEVLGYLNDYEIKLKEN